MHKKTLKKRFIFLLQSFTDKNLYFTEISFRDFCKNSCEKLTKIGANFYGFRLWENNSKKK